jgi:hypothetical protein
LKLLFPSFLQNYNIKIPIHQPFAPSSKFEKTFVEALAPQTPCAMFQKLKKTKGGNNDMGKGTTKHNE